MLFAYIVVMFLSHTMVSTPNLFHSSCMASNTMSYLALASCPYSLARISSVLRPTQDLAIFTSYEFHILSSSPLALRALRGSPAVAVSMSSIPRAGGPAP
jgi:hypothetical protein